MGELMSSEGGLIQTGPFGSQLKQSEYTAEGVPVIMPKDIRNGTIDTDSVARIPEARTSSLARHRVKVNSIVFPRRGEITKRAFITPDHENWICGTGCLKIEPQGKLLDPRFLYYFMGTGDSVDWLLKNAVGSTMLNLSAEIMSRFPIAVPPIDVQKRIASSLSTYDDLIENNRRRVALLEEAARRLYREWFVHFRFPGHEHVKIVDGVPEGWKIVAMEDVCTRITDGSHSSPKSVEYGYPMASVKDMHDWGIETSNCRQISHDDYEKLVRGDCKPLLNDVLIAKDGSYLKHCFVVQDEIDLVILSSIAILRPNDRIDPHLLNFILRDPVTKERMKGYVSGAALPRIILKEFRNFKILLPNDETQRLWADYVLPIARQCDTLIKTNRQLTKARDLLLPRLMDGRLEV